MFKRLVLMQLLFFLFVVFLGCAAFNDGKATNEGQYQTAYKKIKPLAEHGDPEAQYMLAAAYDLGLGVRQNYDEAEKWLRKAANQGYYLAQDRLGWIYSHGHGVSQDYVEAAKWYRKAAEQEFTSAQCILATMYDRGHGVPQDYAEAERWFRRATEHQDYADTVNFFRREAERGDSQSQYILGTIYDRGYGVAQNSVEAEKWYRKAAEQGDADAQSALDAFTVPPGEAGSFQKEIPLEKRRGVYELPVRINGIFTLKFILDTGASEVNIPADVALTLLRTGTIAERDFLPGKLYELADGSTLKSSRFNIRELEVGGIKISQVPASVGSAKGSLLLGQSFLGRLGSWSLDNRRHVLIIGGGSVQPR